jgi:superfamily II RNA helicase
MALKFKITKKQHAALSEDFQLEYKPDGDHFVLDVEGLPEPEDTGALKRAKDRIQADLDETKEELKTTKAELETIKKTQTDGDKDVTKLTAQYDKRTKKMQEELDAKIASLKEKITSKLVESAAEALANQISTAPKLLLGPIKDRLTVEFGEDDTPTLKVLKDGKASDMTMDKLAEDFRANKDYQAVIKASQASGGGTASKNVQLPAGGGTTDETQKVPNLGTADKATLVAHMRNKMSNQGAQQ